MAGLTRRRSAWHLSQVWRTQISCSRWMRSQLCRWHKCSRSGIMGAQISKASILHELRAARAEWDALMVEVGEGRMTKPGAAGDWSVKDVVAHLSSYSRWFVNASEAHFRGQLPPLD